MTNPSQPQSSPPQSTSEVTIRRSPRYPRFMAVGAILGILLALILTSAFEASPEFSKLQIFGFLALLAVVVCATLGAVAALIFDRLGSRHASTVVAERVDVRSEQEGNDDDAAPDVRPTQL